jgi:hypothetical protein
MSDTDKDPQDPFAPGAERDKRPRTMLDLKASEVREGASAAPTPEFETGTSGQNAAQQRGVKDNDTAQERGVNDNRASLAAQAGAGGRFLSYMAAGLGGGLLALVAGFYLLDGFRDRLPFVSQPAAIELKEAQAALAERLGAIEQAGEAARGQLADQIAALDARTEGLARTDDADMVALRERVAGIESRMADLAPASGDNEGLAALRAQLAELSDKLTGLENNVARLEVNRTAQADAARTTALAVAVTNLRRSLERGEAYAPELDTVRKLGPATLSTPFLDGFAAQGVPTQASLQESFRGFARRALRAANRSQDGSIIGQIVESARSVVQVRPTGEPEGDTPEAVIARIETRVEAGELGAALSETENLSGEAAVELLPWVNQVKNRLAANAEMNEIEARLLATVNNP